MFERTKKGCLALPLTGLRYERLITVRTEDEMGDMSVFEMFSLVTSNPH